MAGVVPVLGTRDPLGTHATATRQRCGFSSVDHDARDSRRVVGNHSAHRFQNTAQLGAGSGGNRVRRFTTGLPRVSPRRDPSIGLTVKRGIQSVVFRL